MIIDRTVTMTYTNSRGASITLTPLVADPWHGVYFIEKVDDDLPNDIFSERQTAWHGENVQAFFMGARTLTIYGFLLPDSGNPGLIHTRKRTLESVFNPSLQGELTYKRTISKTNYILPKCIPSQNIVFDVGNAGGLRFTITLKAHDPFWREEEHLEKLAFTAKNIYFPWSIPPYQYPGGVVPQDTSKNYTGMRRNILTTSVINIGDVGTGFKLRFYADGNVTNPRLTNVDTGEYIAIEYAMTKGEYIDIVNMPKEIDIKINGTENGFSKLVEGSKWFTLPVGENKLKFDAEMNVTLLNVYLYYTPLYLGAEN